MKLKKFILILILMILFIFFLPSCAFVNSLTNPISSIVVTSTVPTTTVLISPNQLTLLFPRQGQDPAPVLVSLYNSATTSIDVAIYSITQTSISNALISAHDRGIKVEVISDKTESASTSQKSIINSLLSDGILVRINSHSGIMHLKMSIIDNTIATTGSYNYSNAASDENDEMFVEITNADFITACQSEFNIMWNDNNNFVNAVVR